jgi:ATP-dependent DNA ligase
MPRDDAIIFADLIGKLDAPYKSGPSKAWLKIKNSKAAAATRVLDGTF